MAAPLNNRVRGVRQTLPSGTLIGRLSGGKGPAQQLTLAQLAQTIQQSGNILLPQPGLSAVASGDVLANITGSSAIPVGNTLTAILDFVMGSTEGQILQRGASAWQVLAPGTANQVLASGGAAALNAWAGLSALLDSVFGNTEGNVLQRGSASWQVLAPGLAGQVLTSGGASALNSWATPSAGGTTISNQGAWSGLSGYSIGNVVQYQGVSYLCFATVTAPSGSPGTWSPTDKGSTITLSSANLKATGGATANAIRSNIGETTGKYYVEFIGNNLSNNFTGIGIANLSAPTASIPNTNNMAIGFNVGSIFVNGSSVGSFSGSLVHGGLAIDLSNQLMWWCGDTTASPQAWNGSTSNSPGGAGGISISALGGAGTNLFLYAVLQSNGENFTITPAPPYNNTAPSGFGPWLSGSTSLTSPDLDDTHWLSQAFLSAYIPLHALLGGL